MTRLTWIRTALLASLAAGTAGCGGTVEPLRTLPPPENVMIRSAGTEAYNVADPRFRGGHGLACQADGTCYVSDTFNRSQAIFRVSPDLTITPVETDRPLRGPSGLRFDKQGRLHALELNGGTLVRIGEDGRVEELARGLGGPWNLAFTADGAAIVACDNGDVWRIKDGGKQKLYAATGEHPFDVEVDAQGFIYVSLQGAHDLTTPVREPISKIVRLDPRGQATVFAGGFLVAEGMAFDASGRLYVVDTHEGAVYRVAAGGAREVLAKGLQTPIHLAFRQGELLVFYARGELSGLR